MNFLSLKFPSIGSNIRHGQEVLIGNGCDLKDSEEENDQRSLVSLSYCVCFPFGETMDFRDRELYPDHSCSGESSEEFVAECRDTTDSSDWKTAHCLLS